MDMNKHINKVMAVIIAAGCAVAVAVALAPGHARAAVTPHYVVLKTQPRRAQQRTLNTAASAGYRLVAETDNQTILVKP
jgi:hypothetical protein